MDDFREWLSDNLRYILLGTAVLLVLVVLFVGVRACSGVKKGESGDDSKGGKTVTISQTDDPSSTATNGETTDEKNESSNELQKDAIPEVTQLVHDYYSALGAKDVTALKELIDELSADDEARIKNSNNFIEGYQVSEVYSKSGVNEGDYLVYCCYDMTCVNLSTPIPALGQLYIRTIDGKLKICGNMGADPAISAALSESIKDTDVKALISRINQSFDEARKSDPDMDAYIQRLNSVSGMSTPSENSNGSTLVASELCNVRSAPSEDGEIIGGLYQGEEVEKLDQTGQWIKIDYYGETGYVFAELLVTPDKYVPPVTESSEEEYTEEGYLQDTSGEYTQTSETDISYAQEESASEDETSEDAPV